jgi:hypothetical protein
MEARVKRGPEEKKAKKKILVLRHVSEWGKGKRVLGIIFISPLVAQMQI